MSVANLLSSETTVERIVAIQGAGGARGWFSREVMVAFERTLAGEGWE